MPPSSRVKDGYSVVRIARRDMGKWLRKRVGPVLGRLLVLRRPDRAWRRGKSWELRFWRKFLDPDGHWGGDVRRRMDPSSPVDNRMLVDCLDRIPRERVAILDVGAGPITIVGYTHPGKELQVTATDALAADYDRLLATAGLAPPVRTLGCKGEELLQHFEPASFDIAYARNSVDHSIDPRLIIENMLRLVRPDGFVVLEHLRNEGRSAGYRGLHQWNLDESEGRLVLWRDRGPQLDVGSLLADRGEVRAWSEGDWVMSVIQPTRERNEVRP
jgi:SAM-dependent methyltransferase